MIRYNLTLAVLIFIYQTISLSSNIISIKPIRCESFFINKFKKEQNRMDNKSFSTFTTKNGQTFNLKVLTSDQVNTYLNDIASFRIKYFKDFPYMYEGNMDYEQKYIGGFVKDKKAILVVAVKDNQIVAVSTALPLISDADILGDAPKKFLEKGLNPKDFFYYGEIIIKPEYRGLGVAKAIMSIQEAFAKNLNYKKITLSTVVRSKDDPRAPIDYISSDIVWHNLGFKKEDIFMEYEWPTIIDQVTVRSIENRMVFWTKTIGTL